MTPAESRQIYPATLHWPPAVDDLNKVAITDTRVRLISGAAGFEKLKTFAELEALWCFGIDRKKLGYISQCSSLRCLYLDYNLRTDDIGCLLQLPNLRVLTLDSCSKFTSLEQLADFTNLTGLSVTNFKNVHEIEPLANLNTLRELAVDGGMWTRMKIQSLAPLANLRQLEYLSLTNTKVLDESLEPLGELTNLKQLTIANFYPFEEFAKLSTRLVKTKCQWFAPFIKTTFKCPKCQVGDLVMLTGKGRPMLCECCDADRLERFVSDFVKIANQG
jgi:hypothetical protein